MNGKCFAAHRHRLIEVLKEHRLSHSIVLLRSGVEQQEPFSEGELPFYQEALFYWLTGWKEPNSAIIIDVIAEKSILLIPDYDDDYEVWTGPIPCTEDIIEKTGVDEVTTMEALDSVTEEILSTSRPLYRFLGYPEKNALKIDDVTTLITVAGIARKVKFAWEIECCRKAALLTGDAIVHVMKNTRPGISEKCLEANFLCHGMMNGADGLCFPTIAASGQNGAYLHYLSNSSIIPDNSLILLDCGFFYNHYSGDISRTFPANGKFTEPQRLVYNMLLKLQLELIDAVKPGITIHDLDMQTMLGVFDILKQLRIVDNDDEFDFDIACVFIPHGVSHHIGCNNHDPVINNGNSKVKPSKDEDMLGPGMVISMEPGLYFNKISLERARDDKLKMNYDIALEYCDTIGGIRIEDDILVTNDGHEVLSNCPKTVEQIEEIMHH